MSKINWQRGGTFYPDRAREQAAPKGGSSFDGDLYRFFVIECSCGKRWTKRTTWPVVRAGIRCSCKRRAFGKPLT